MPVTEVPKLTRTKLSSLVLAPLVVLLLSGCLEQLLSPRSPAGSLNNFFLHLYGGELNDARDYFAAGLVDLTPELDNSIKSAADRLRRYEIEIRRPLTDSVELREELDNGQIRQFLPGRARPRLGSQSPTPGPDEGWVVTNIMSAEMVERGPGWRIIEFELECCQDQEP